MKGSKTTIELDRTQMGGRSFFLPSRSSAEEASVVLAEAWEGNFFVWSKFKMGKRVVGTIQDYPVFLSSSI